MEYKRFFFYNVIGAVIWAIGLTLLGYFLGSVDVVKNNIEIAIVAIVYGGYELFQNGVKGAPFAGDMLMLSTGLSKAIMEVKFSDLLDEAKMLQTYEEEKSKELETADDLLGKESRLDPFVIFGEKPDEYFNRTVHYGNIGTLGITAISSYVDVALTLPKIQDTLGEKIYG